MTTVVIAGNNLPLEVVHNFLLNSSHLLATVHLTLMFPSVPVMLFHLPWILLLKFLYVLVISFSMVQCMYGHPGLVRSSVFLFGSILVSKCWDHERQWDWVGYYCLGRHCEWVTEEPIAYTFTFSYRFLHVYCTRVHKRSFCEPSIVHSRHTHKYLLTLSDTIMHHLATLLFARISHVSISLHWINSEMKKGLRNMTKRVCFVHIVICWRCLIHITKKARKFFPLCIRKVRAYILAVFHIHCTVHSWSTLKQADQRYSNMLYISLWHYL